MAKFRVGEQIVITQFVKDGVEHAGREGFVEIVESRRRYTVLLYKTDRQPECTLDVREYNIRKN